MKYAKFYSVLVSERKKCWYTLSWIKVPFAVPGGNYQTPPLSGVSTSSRSSLYHAKPLIALFNLQVSL